MHDPDFMFDRSGLQHALDLLSAGPAQNEVKKLPHSLPTIGMGNKQALDFLAPLVLGQSSDLGASTAFAHMDPPTPWITWATAMWNASLNQNLLHPALSPFAKDAETQVVSWLAPYFGMDGGHMVPGASVANLTALWVARERAGVRQVVYGQSAHLSIGKAANILGLEAVLVPCDASGAICVDALPTDLSTSALVLTAGTTSTGAIDNLSANYDAAWLHVDAAWAGPLRLSSQHEFRLAGIEQADSVAISAHKWLFQPKESALILFRDSVLSHDAISFGGAYLAAPNVGILGSHGATAIPLLAMLLAWGKEGLEQRIDTCMSACDQVAQFIAAHPSLDMLCRPVSGVLVWRPRDATKTQILFEALPSGSTSQTSLASGAWLRNVAANPNFDFKAFTAALDDACSKIL